MLGEQPPSTRATGTSLGRSSWSRRSETLFVLSRLLGHVENNSGSLSTGSPAPTTSHRSFLLVSPFLGSYQWVSQGRWL